eukprot:m.56952 g.56952  ORF g.56952 m.56952 type:complete len:60 (+) comp22321_c0_seq1:939-1118(+)
MHPARERQATKFRMITSDMQASFDKASAAVEPHHETFKSATSLGKVVDIIAVKQLVDVC